MRNSSNGASLAPLPFEASVVGLDVMDLSPIEALLAAHEAALANLTPAERGTRMHELVVNHFEDTVPSSMSPTGRLFERQRGSVDLTFGLFLLVIVALMVLMAYVTTQSINARDRRMTDDIEACIQLGGTPTVLDGRVRCADRKAVQQ